MRRKRTDPGADLDFDAVGVPSMTGKTFRSKGSLDEGQVSGHAFEAAGPALDFPEPRAPDMEDGAVEEEFGE